jgi:tight adherence protein B
MALGVFHKQRTETLEDRIAAYSRTGDARSAAPTPGVRLETPKPEGIAGSAVGMAQKALESNKGIEVALGSRLEAAGLSLKPAEWLLMHAGIAVGAGILGFLLSSGGILLTLVLLFFGTVGPWVYLGFKRGRRLKAFGGQLADTLQLMSGSLSAGLSLTQSVDTVVREGSEPMSAEFKRAIIEARLGVDIEDALESVGTRMDSQDFHWVVMAVRIQREVGGNLAELLNNVANTLREREYLRRQVAALSAEGRLSAWILGGLPPVFLLYLALSKPTYVEPLFKTPIGWVMLGMMAVLIAVGGFWMKKLVKVEV